MSRGAVIAAITVLLGALVSIFILHPFTPGFLQDGLDASWVAVMGDAADRHARWGVDLAFTYGPATPLVMNFYNDAYFTHTLPLLIGFALLFGLCMALIVVGPGRSRRATAFGTLAAAAAIVAAKSTSDTFFLTLPLLVFLIAVAPARLSAARRLTVVAGGVAMGLTAMAKMSFPLAALPLFLLADIAAVARRRLPLLLVPFAVGVVAGDLFYGQRLTDFAAYLAFQGDVVAGYTAAMMIPGPLWDLGAFLAFGAALVAAGFWSVSPEQRRTVTAWIPALGIVIDLFFLFKAGFIRHDLHSLIAWRGSVLVAVMIAFGLLLPRRRRTAQGIVAAAAFVAFVYEPVLAVRQSGEKPRSTAIARLYGGWLTSGPPQELAAARDFLLDPAGFRSDLDARRAELRKAVADSGPLGALPGTVDALPSVQSRVLAAGLDYHPRPSFQEYSTYTEGLAQANRSFIEGSNAPDWLLFGPESGRGWMSIDGRYPNLAEGALWPDLMRLYRPDHRIGSLVALKRRAEPVRLPIGPARTVTVGANVEVPVAEHAADAIWARVELQPNLLGRAASFLFRVPLTYLAVRLADGETHRYRFVPALGQAGFILSPLVFNAPEFADLAEGRAADRKRRVVALTIETSRIGAALYDPAIRWSFSPIDTSALRDAKADPLPEMFGSAWDRLLATRPGQGLDASGHVAANAPSSLGLPAEGLKRLTLAYGVADGAWQEGHTAGVCFAVFPSDASSTALWETCLDPLDRAEDRGPHVVSLDLPAGSTELALETICREACGAGWAYWAKPEEAAAAGSK